MANWDSMGLAIREARGQTFQTLSRIFDLLLMFQKLGRIFKKLGHMF